MWTLLYALAFLFASFLELQGYFDTVRFIGFILLIIGFILNDILSELKK